MNASARRVAVLGGIRIPFARQNGPYARASNQDMMTATLEALVGKFSLEGEVLGEVAAGGVLKHSRDFNLTRECVLGTRLDPHTPAYDVQQACGTGLEATILVANKIALGQIDSGIAGGVRHDLGRADRDQRGPARRAARAEPREEQRGPAQGAGQGPPAADRPAAPAQRRAPHRACRWASTPRSWPPNGGSRARSRTSSRSAAIATWRRRTTRASSTTSSCRSSGSSATRTCGPTPASRSSRS